MRVKKHSHFCYEMKVEMKVEMKRILFKAKIQGHKGYVYGVPHNVYACKGQNYKWFDSMQYIDDDGVPRVEYIESDTLVQLTEAEIEERISVKNKEK